MCVCRKPLPSFATSGRGPGVSNRNSTCEFTPIPGVNVRLVKALTVWGVSTDRGNNVLLCTFHLMNLCFRCVTGAAASILSRLRLFFIPAVSVRPRAFCRPRLAAGITFAYPCLISASYFLFCAVGPVRGVDRILYSPSSFANGVAV